MILRDFLPSLSTLSSIEIEYESSIAEMAGHCCALIVSRGVEGGIRKAEKRSESTSWFDRISSLENDFNSSSIPIRARGAVKLQHLARLVVQDRDNNRERHRGPLIQEISPEEGTSRKLGNIDMNSDFELGKLLDASIKALKDEESYIYLAAIQAISALGDVSPKFVIPYLLQGLVRGDIDTGLYESLSNSQRAKIAEALIHIIRRRGSALNHHVRNIVERLLVGSRTVYTEERSIDNQTKVSTATLNYFDFGLSDGNFINLDEDDLKESYSEKEIRLNTGGPVFSCEEDALVRSSCIICLAEVFVCAEAAVVASFVKFIVLSCIDALRLSNDRPVSMILILKLSIDHLF